MNTASIVKLEELAAIVFRVSAIVLGVYAAKDIPAAIFAVSINQPGYWSVGAIAASVLLILLAAAVWKYALVMGRWLVNFAPMSVLPESSLLCCKQLAYLVVGLLTLINAITDGVYWALLVLGVGSFFGIAEITMTEENVADIFGTAIEFLIGIYLVVFKVRNIKDD